MNKNYTDELMQKGIVRIENFLNSKELNSLSKIIKYYSAPKGSPNSYFPTNIKLLLYKVLKFDFIKLKHSLTLLNFEKKKGLGDLVSNISQKKSYLRYIDAYYNKVSSKAILPWHTDQAYHGSKNPKEFVHPDDYFIKIFIYLTDVGSDNGCMSYIPQSHKIGYAIRKGIYEKKISYEPYWNLKDLRKIVKKKDNLKYFENYFKDKSFIEKFFDLTKFIENDSNDREFDYSAKAGSTIIFNEGGVHKGSKNMLTDRMVLRYLYSAFKR